jgi:two-component system response regulator RegX3
VHIKRIRSKIEQNPSEPERLVTVRGLGYRFEA